MTCCRAKDDGRPLGVCRILYCARRAVDWRHLTEEQEEVEHLWTKMDVGIRRWEAILGIFPGGIFAFIHLCNSMHFGNFWHVTDHIIILFLQTSQNWTFCRAYGVYSPQHVRDSLAIRMGKHNLVYLLTYVVRSTVILVFVLAKLRLKSGNEQRLTMV